MRVFERLSTLAPGPGVHPEPRALTGGLVPRPICFPAPEDPPQAWEGFCSFFVPKVSRKTLSGRGFPLERKSFCSSGLPDLATPSRSFWRLILRRRDHLGSRGTRREVYFWTLAPAP